MCNSHHQPFHDKRRTLTFHLLTLKFQINTLSSNMHVPRVGTDNVTQMYNFHHQPFYDLASQPLIPSFLCFIVTFLTFSPKENLLLTSKLQMNTLSSNMCLGWAQTMSHECVTPTINPFMTWVGISICHRN